MEVKPVFWLPVGLLGKYTLTVSIDCITQFSALHSLDSHHLNSGTYKSHLASDWGQLNINHPFWLCSWLYYNSLSDKQFHTQKL